MITVSKTKNRGCLACRGRDNNKPTPGYTIDMQYSEDSKQISSIGLCENCIKDLYLEAVAQNQKPVKYDGIYGFHQGCVLLSQSEAINLIGYAEAMKLKNGGRVT